MLAQARSYTINYYPYKTLREWVENLLHCGNAKCNVVHKIYNFVKT